MPACPSRRSINGAGAISRPISAGLFRCGFLPAFFLVTLFAEFLANDKPLLIRHDGAYYMPVFKTYAETEFGGDFATEADYRDPFVVELIEGAEGEKDGFIVWPPLRYQL